MHTRLVSAQPATADSVTLCAPSCEAFRLNVCCDGKVALPASVSRSRSAGTPEPGQVEVEVLRIRRRIGHLDDGQRRVLGVRERADHVLARIDVQRRRARARFVEESRRAPVHTRSVSDQPASADSVTVCAPS